MKLLNKPHQPNEKKLIFTEGIDYLMTGLDSIWGPGDRDMLVVLKKRSLPGKWMNLAAGDGRYNLELLKRATLLTATDIDKSALNKLWHNTPKRLRKKLTLKSFDVTKKFPFRSGSFDGIFCAGLLHLFSEKIFNRIARELDRILKPGGLVIIDFPFDIRRRFLDGRKYVLLGEPLYNRLSAERLLKKAFRKYQVRMTISKVSEEIYARANPPYEFSSKFIIFKGQKSFNHGV